MHGEEDPRGADFKAIGYLGRDQNQELSELLELISYRAHVFMSAYKTVEVSLGQNPIVVNEFALKSLREISDLSV